MKNTLQYNIPRNDYSNNPLQIQRFDFTIKIELGGVVRKYEEV